MGAVVLETLKTLCLKGSVSQAQEYVHVCVIRKTKPIEKFFSNERAHVVGEQVYTMQLDPC